MEVLMERDWRFILDSVYLFNSCAEEKELQSEVLNRLRAQIDYDKAAFYLASRKDGKVVSRAPIGINIQQKNLEDFITKGYDNDEYFRCFYFEGHSRAFRDSDMLVETVRLQTSIYQEIYAREDIFYCARCSFVCGNELLGYLALFRPQSSCEFSHKDILILNTVAEHIAQKLWLLKHCSPHALESTNNMIGMLIQRYDLTIREAEVATYMLNGLTNVEICEMLYITPSTLKKHLNKILKKTNAKNKRELLTFISYG